MTKDNDSKRSLEEILKHLIIPPAYVSGDLKKAIETIRTALQRSADKEEYIKKYRAKTCENYKTLNAEIEALKAQIGGLVKALEIIAKRPELPNPERDADWKNCMKWSSHDAKEALQRFSTKEGT